jgi:hypothetical protein
MPSRVNVRFRFHADIGQTCQPKQLRQAAADECISTVHLLGAAEDLGQPVPRRMRRVAHAPTPIRFQHRDPSPRPGQPHHLGDHRRRVRDVDQQRPGMHQIEGVRWEVCPVGISLDYLDVGQAPLSGELAGQRHIGRLEVQADDLSRRPNPIGQQIQNSARPAAQIDRLPSLGEDNPVQ